MMSNRLRVVIGAMSITLLVTPALIWSDKHTHRATANDISIKLPSASTVGPEEHPYTPSSLELTKRLADTPYSSPPHHSGGLPQLNARSKNTHYPGMTTAETRKLEGMRETLPNSQSPAIRKATDANTTIVIVPRPAGSVGLTPHEKAKREEHRNRR